MKKLLFLAFIILIILISLIALKTPNSSKIIINNHSIDVEIANSDELRSKGLSGRKSLNQDSGMLFIFPTPGRYSFWMKDMNFPLDFVKSPKSPTSPIRPN